MTTTLIILKFTFWLTLVGVIVALIANQYKKTGKSFPWGRTVIIILILALVVWIGGCINGCRKEARTNRPPAVTQTVERSWTIQTFNIPEEGLKVYLYPGWKDFPLRGPITIETPNGTILNDEPGVDHQFGWQPEGNYIIRANPSGCARGIRIYNKWPLIALATQK